MCSDALQHPFRVYTRRSSSSSRRWASKVWDAAGDLGVHLPHHALGFGFLRGFGQFLFPLPAALDVSGVLHEEPPHGHHHRVSR